VEAREEFSTVQTDDDATQDTRDTAYNQEETTTVRDDYAEYTKCRNGSGSYGGYTTATKNYGAEMAMTRRGGENDDDDWDKNPTAVSSRETL
jgi:hypothetical protein